MNRLCSHACTDVFLKVGISTVCSPFPESPSLHLVFISLIKTGFQLEHISYSWPGCLPADHYVLLSDLKTEGMLVKLLNQLKLMFRSVYQATLRDSPPRGLWTAVLHMYCFTSCTVVIRSSQDFVSLCITENLAKISSLIKWI